MNAINIAGSMIQLTATSKLSLVAAVLAFGMLCVYKMITSERWFSMLVGVLLLIGAAYVLTGCVPADPMRSAAAQERANQSAINVQQSNAQMAQAQQADDEARRNAERLQALQAQQAIVQGQAVVAQAQSQTAINASNNAAVIAVAAQMAAANKPDYTPFVILLIVAMAMAPLFVFLAMRARQQPQPMAMRQLPVAVYVEPRRIQIPAAVQAQADRHGGAAQWDGQRWLIVDDDGHVLARQRLLTGG